MEIKDINLDDYEVSQQADEEIIVLRKKHRNPKCEDFQFSKDYSPIKCFIGNNSLICRYCSSGYVEDKIMPLKEKHAKIAIAKERISQLMPYYGGEITDEEWENGTLRKFVITRDKTYILSRWYTDAYNLLAFHTEEQRDEFLKNNKQLVKDYLMIE